MAELTYREAVAWGIAQEMRRDPNLVMLGEDIAAAGGVFKTTVGLLDEFGPERIRDTPISEQAIIGAAMGAAMTGIPVIAEIMFSDFLAVCWDMIANEIAKSRYMTDGQVSFPLVIRTANGGGVRFGAQHSQSVENWAMMIPGLKVVAPSTPVDVIGLMAASIRDPDPVVFFEHKSLMATKAEIPEGEIIDQLGQARVVRDGGDVTIAALALMVPRALEAAAALEADGISAVARIGSEDRSLLHGGRESASVWMGRGTGIDCLRRIVLGSRWSRGPHHHPPHPATSGGGPRGSGAALGRPHLRDHRQVI
jgi:pyruvate dehydrogenase E1 component beta subunit